MLRLHIETFRFQDKGRRLRVGDLTSSFFAYSQNIDTPESFILPFSLEKLALLPLVKEVTPSTDRKMIKFLTFDNLFPLLRHSR